MYVYTLAVSASFSTLCRQIFMGGRSTANKGFTSGILMSLALQSETISMSEIDKAIALLQSNCWSLRSQIRRAAEWNLIVCGRNHIHILEDGK